MTNHITVLNTFAKFIQENTLSGKLKSKPTISAPEKTPSQETPLERRKKTITAVKGKEANPMKEARPAETLRDKAVKLLGDKAGNAKADHYKKAAAKMRAKGKGLGKSDTGTKDGARDNAQDTTRRDAPGDR
tara:strand:+ start:36545 stop:36940 length:396 start_codon:yes stop_codon:yes gene_type:complete